MNGTVSHCGHYKTKHKLYGKGLSDSRVELDQLI